MVQLDTANQSHIPGPRRHTESPALWISVIAGSMLLHTLLFLGLRIYLARTAKIQPAAEPIAVEFVEPSANTTAAPTAPSSAAAPNTTTPAAPPTAEPELPFPPEASAPSMPAPSATVPDSRAQAPPETPASAPSARDVPELSPSPVPDRPVPSTPTPSLPPDGSTGAPGNQPGESPSGGGSLPAPPPTLSPGGSPTEEGGSNDSGDSNPPVVPISPERGQGTGVQLTVTGLSQVDAGRDVVDALPQQSLPTLSLPEQIYPAGVGLNFGTPVTIRVLLDQQGKPKRIINIQRGSASADYDQLAKELLLQAQFPPVLQSQRQGQGVEQTVDITLTLNPVQQ